MAELRFNPLLGTWTLVNANRQKRPDLPKGNCPFCPGENPKLPEKFDVLKYDNDFPILRLDPDVPDFQGTFGKNSPYQVAENYGKAEVILYSDQHETEIHQLSQSHVEKLVGLWCERNAELSSDGKIKYVYIFENRGREVGATIAHPHGQIYAFPFVPQKLEVELSNSKAYFEEKGECLICAMNREEKDFGGRIITENESFYAYLPFFTDFPYGVFLTAKRHFGNLSEMTKKEKSDLAEMFRHITGAFDRLFDRPFPYMMAMHQTPVNSKKYDGSGEYYHFHIEFYPPLRSKDRIKFYASSETGAWAAANPLRVEDTAQELKSALGKYLEETSHDEVSQELF